MSENFEKSTYQPNRPPEADLLKPPAPHKKSFSDAMSELKDTFTTETFMELKDLPGYKNITAGIGLRLPLPDDSTKVTLGVEGRASLFSTAKGAHLAKSIEPSLRITRDLGKNTQIMAKVSPSPREYARIGMVFKF